MMTDLLSKMILLILLFLSFLTPLFLLFSWRYSVRLKELILVLPESAYGKLKDMSKVGIDSIKMYLKEEVKAWYKQPDYVLYLLKSGDFDELGIQRERAVCYKSYKRCKVCFLILCINLVFLIFTVIGISWIA
ncbi:MAG: hypothetical protein BM556_11445 [Bacteriovorax sp. MedPE-SWde]|nr:MAG: hypothetical protein BM556_11445 [Bacteriovorax sp. MedPE-SWde]